MESYWIVGTVEEVAKRGNPQSDVYVASDDKKVMQGGIEKEIDGRTYLIVPLTEICCCFDLAFDCFLDDQIIDRMNELKKKKGYYPIITF